MSLDIRNELMRFSTCDVSDALDVLGLREQTAVGITRLWDDCPKIAGRVMPMLLGPDYEGSTVIGTLRAIEAAEPGDVLIFDNGGRLGENTFGSIAAFCAQRVGAVGAIADGASRDVDDMRTQGFPVYAKGVSTTTVRGRVGMADFNIPVKLSGIAVNPGDYVLADGSGVVVIPSGVVERVIELAPRFQEFERVIRGRVIRGGGFVEVHEQYRYEDFEDRVSKPIEP